MGTGKLKTRKQQIADFNNANEELITLKRKVLSGEPVPNFEYNRVLKKLRKIRRGNWRVFEVNIIAEAQSDWTPTELKEHFNSILEDSLLRRYKVKVKVVISERRTK